MARPSDITSNTASASVSASTSSSYYSRYVPSAGFYGFFDEQLDTPLSEEAWAEIRKTLSMTAADVEAKIKAEEAAKELAAMSIEDNDADDTKPSSTTSSLDEASKGKPTSAP
eukprot:CAMPEP_0181051886 /NCGR_PEP_ID=MMETSP1070-20121207/17294_1 /TAXON_ID=265543 /ORGANISM="Minutocellus polymorphus, Strain NH13" /LENGTH=112 /DNA_ID=CAMNT_0023130939 /DNA_START=99 /DNA_END=437 /DNA_ORIENTATION=+